MTRKQPGGEKMNVGMTESGGLQNEARHLAGISGVHSSAQHSKILTLPGAARHLTDLAQRSSWPCR